MSGNREDDNVDTSSMNNEDEDVVSNKDTLWALSDVKQIFMLILQGRNSKKVQNVIM